MKSKVPWPELIPPMMQRTGQPAGKSEERRMVTKVGGTDGIRRVDTFDLNGNHHILNTRNGNPIIRTKTASRETPGEVTAVRGFVAHVPVEQFAALFSPYTLEVYNPKYTVFKNTYTVLLFATTYNVPSDDATKWFDVASFYSGKVLINGKEMSLLKTTDAPSGPYIPWIIPHTGTNLDKYGEAVTNDYEKRVFAVGRDQVMSWANSGTVSNLLPVEARTNARALTIGQRIDGDSAYLGQIFSYPYEPGWDGLCEWYWASAKVDMTIASPYLAKADSVGGCVVPYVGLASAGSSSGNMAVPRQLPSTPLWLTGTGSVVFSATNSRVIWWPWGGTVSSPMEGETYSSYTRESYSGSSSGSITFSGVPITYTCTNSKNWDLRNESTNVVLQTITLLPQIGAAAGDNLSANETTLFWTYEDPLGYRGRTTYYHGLSTIPGSNATGRRYEEQSGSFVVSTPYADLVNLSFARSYSYGNSASISPDGSYYDGYLANPTGLIGVSTGMGAYGRVELGYIYNPTSDIIPINDYYKQNPSPPPDQTPEVLAEIVAAYDTRAAAYAAQILYDNENSSSYEHMPYTASITTETRLSVNLTWSTTDYILHDVENGVFISITAEFEGVDTAANLTVNLKVKTRHGEATRELAKVYYSYGEMLPEKILDSSGKKAVPSPLLRAMFAPLYQEQGSFKGAHYITQAEEGNGAAPAHLFNFTLFLQNYHDLATCNDSNAAYEGVFFVPCNLLEMLYAYVFSTKYGVDEFQRYPVDFTERYNTMMTTLFSTGIRVVFRDGAFTDWLDTLEGEYATSTTTELTRT